LLDAGQPGEPAHQFLLPRPDLPDDRDNRPLRPLVVERRHPLGEDVALHAEDLGLAGGPGHHDEHRWLILPVRSNKKAEVSTSALPARPAVSGPTNRDRSCRASKVEEATHGVERTVATAEAAVSAGPPRRAGCHRGPPPRGPRRPRPAPCPGLNRPAAATRPGRRSPRRPRSSHRR